MKIEDRLKEQLHTLTHEPVARLLQAYLEAELDAVHRFLRVERDIHELARAQGRAQVLVKILGVLEAKPQKTA